MFDPPETLALMPATAQSRATRRHAQRPCDGSCERHECPSPHTELSGVHNLSVVRDSLRRMTTQSWYSAETPTRGRPTAAHAGRTFVAEALAALIFATCFQYSGATWRGFARFLKESKLPGADIFSKVFAPGLDEYSYHIYGAVFVLAGMTFVFARSLPWGASLAILGPSSAAFLDLGTWPALVQVVLCLTPGVLLGALARGTTEHEGQSWFNGRHLQEAALTSGLYLGLSLIVIVPAAVALASAAH
jgi:hypothetical protein